MMTTLHDALQSAHAYWEAKGPSSRMMSIRANECAKALPLRTPLAALDKTAGTKVLTHLAKTGKSKGSIAAYYAAFRRAVELGGGDCRGWPKAGAPPRKCREPLTEADLDRLAGMLMPRWEREEGFSRNGAETAALLELLRGTGLRVEVEALRSGALDWNPEAKLLRITGKGGHERVIPVERKETVALLNNPEALKAMRRLSYSGHLKRWTEALGRMRYTEKGSIKSLKPTPHAVRHYYATRAYERSGHNLKAVQELLGHADISTTARYLGVNVEDLRAAVS